MGMRNTEDSLKPLVGVHNTLQGFDDVVSCLGPASDVNLTELMH